MIDIVACKVNEELKKEAKKLGFANILGSDELRIKKGSKDLENRAILEKQQTQILMNPEILQEKDSMHARRSGINHVLAKIAAKNTVTIGFGLSYLLEAKGRKRTDILGRMQQNVLLCRKAKAPMMVCSYASDVKGLRGAKDLQAFARLLGMTGKEAKAALDWKLPKKALEVLY